MARFTKKITLFYTLATLLPVLLVGLSELGLRQTSVYISNNLSEMISSSNKSVINPDYYKRYFSSFLPSVSISPFQNKKDANTFRILAFGGSTMAGYPYSHHFSSAALVEQNLKKSFPYLRFEVLNFAVTAFNSFGIADLSTKMDVLQPDAILIYAGHNEFYGTLGSASTEGLAESAFFRRTYLNLYSSALFQFGINLIRSDRYTEHLTESRATTMSRMIGNASVPYEADLYTDTLIEFERNLGAIQQNADKLGVPVVISTIVSNLKDQPPLGNDQLATEAYTIGESFFEIGHIDSALVWFSKARDLDPLRFRAPSQINQIIRSLSRQDNSYLVDLDSIYRTICESGIEDHSCFTDHLHPNYAGYQFISEQFSATIESLVSSKTGFKPIRSRKITNLQLDEIEKRLSELNIEILTSAPPFDKQGQNFQDIMSTLQNTNDPISKTVFSILTNKTHPSIAFKDFASKELNDNNINSWFYYSWSEWDPLDESILQIGLTDLVNDQSIDPSAEPLLLKAVNKYDNISYHNMLGALYLQQKEYDAAKSFLHIVEKRSPMDSNMLFNLAVLHYETGDIDQALEYQLKYQHSVNQSDTMSSPNAGK